jgi:hypothetical protein
MPDQIEPEDNAGQSREDRRAFLAKAGKVAVTAPAAALLLAATARNAQAVSGVQGPPP